MKSSYKKVPQNKQLIYSQTSSFQKQKKVVSTKKFEASLSFLPSHIKGVA
jgi:hypothetical protein